MNKLRNLKRNLPENPGVYIFWQKTTPLYIGKAKNLKNRVQSYFSGELSSKTSRMVSEADSLTYIKVDSELESLLLEASLIRKNQPKYNSASKDDKHPLYIKITKEKYPRIITARKIEEKDSLAFFGPFPSSGNVYSVLKMLRRIFPFSDHKVGKRPCLYSHIGLCNPCPNEIEKEKNEEIKKSLRGRYLRNIRMVKKVLSRRIDTVKRELEKNMRTLSEREKFEEALVLREQLERLDYITQPIIPAEYFLENPNLTEDLRKQELNNLKIILKNCKLKIVNLHRIECYDVAHLAGSSPAASMVTFINGELDKSYYRHFRIRKHNERDDLKSLREVARRRTKYFASWGKPNLIVVDGGKTQVNVFNSIFEKHYIPVIGIAKRFETLIFPKGAEFRLKRSPALNLIQRMRDEAHRFARRYHHKLIRKVLLTPEA